MTTIAFQHVTLLSVCISICTLFSGRLIHSLQVCIGTERSDDNSHFHNVILQIVQILPSIGRQHPLECMCIHIDGSFYQVSFSKARWDNNYYFHHGNLIDQSSTSLSTFLRSERSIK